MKKILKAVSLLLLTASIASCDGNLGSFEIKAADQKSSLDKYRLLYPLKQDVTVTGKATLTTEYLSTLYSGYNSSATYSINREFQKITDADGNTVNAVRNQSSSGINVYLENDKDGGAYYQSLNASNEVVDVAYSTSGLQILFSNVFSNPFDYIYEEDIGDDGSLSSLKATFIINTLFGYDFHVNEAMFDIDEDGFATGLNFDIEPGYGSQLVDSQGNYVNFKLGLSVNLSFSYLEGGCTLITPSSNSNSELRSAFDSMGDNFTLTIFSNGLTESVVYYATENGIYVHKSAGVIGYGDGDVYYAKTTSGYRPFTYDLANYNWVRGTSIVQKTDILADMSVISDAVFEEIGDGVYSLIRDARAVAYDSYVVPGYSFEDEGAGYYGEVRIEDGKIASTTSVSSSLTGSVALNQIFSDYGTTALPGYVEVEDITGGLL